MAEFKKIPDGDSVGGPFDAITSEAAGQFAATYWPVVLRGLVLFLLVLNGNERAAIPVAAVVVLPQAWRWGLFG